MSSFLQNIKVSSALDYASGTADRTGTILDMSGYEGVICVVKLATVAAGGTTSFHMQQDTAVAMGSAAAISGTQKFIDGADDNDVIVYDVNLPRERYVRLYVNKDGSNACAESAIFIQYGPGYAPITNAVADSVYTKEVSYAAEGNS